MVVLLSGLFSGVLPHDLNVNLLMTSWKLQDEVHGDQVPDKADHAAAEDIDMILIIITIIVFLSRNELVLMREEETLLVKMRDVSCIFKDKSA